MSRPPARAARWLVGALCALGLWASVARAEVPPSLSGEHIVEVALQGEDAGVADPSVVGIARGAVLTRRLLRDATERLLASGRWADVSFYALPTAGGVRLVAWLVPRVLVLRVDLRGNRALDAATLRSALGVDEGSPIDDESLAEIRRRLRQTYAAHGYDEASVELSLRVTDDPTRDVLLVSVDEGRPTRIRRVRFEGDQPPPASGAIDVLADHGVAPGARLDPSSLDEAIEAAQDRMRAQGFLEASLTLARIARVTAASAGASEAAEATADDAATGPEADLVLTSHVGPRYRLRFRGYAPLDRSDVLAALRVGEDRLDAGVLSAMARRVEGLYRQKGYLDAKARVFRSASASAGWALLSVAIERGPLVAVERVAFPGATHFSAGFLRGQVVSYLDEALRGDSVTDVIDPRVVALLMDARVERASDDPGPVILPPAKVYDADAYERAVDHIEELYQAAGYLDVKVGPARLLREAPTRARVVVPVVEGTRTFLHRVRITGNSALSTRALIEATALSRGMPFSKGAVEAARRRIVARYQRAGYLYVRVEPKTLLSGDRTRAAVRFDVVERYPVHIGTVTIVGAVRTREALVRRVLPLHRGDLLVPERIRDAERRLMELGVFTAVVIRPRNAELPERVKPIVVRLTERNTQVLDFRAGVSTGEGARGGFDYTYRNLFGSAMAVTLGVQLANQFFFLDEQLKDRYARLSLADRLERRVSIALSFPYLPPLPNVRASLSLLNERDNERNFGLDKTSLDLTFTYRPRPLLTLALSQGIENSDVGLLIDGKTYQEVIEESDQRLRELLRVPQGRSTLVFVGLRGDLDFRDNPFTPTRGGLLSIDTEWVHTLETQSVQTGNERTQFFSHHLSIVAGLTGYVPLGRETVLALQGRYGRIIHLSHRSETYPNRQFFLGGIDTVRGYRQDAMIPQDLADAIRDNPQLDPRQVVQGGDTFLLARAELRFPIVGSLRGGLFADFGNLWRDPKRLDPLALRPTAGLGLRIRTPVGPIAFDYGILLARRRYLDEGFGAFHFSIGLF